MEEIVSARQRGSKTFLIERLKFGRARYAIDSVVGLLHWNTDERNLTGEWRDIDTRFVNGKVRKAPYDLDLIDGSMPRFRYKSKHSGEYEVRLIQARGYTPRSVEPVFEGNRAIWRDFYPDVDIVLVAGNGSVTLQRILKTSNAPTEYEIGIEGVRGRALVLPIRPACDTNSQALAMEAEATVFGRMEKLSMKRRLLLGTRKPVLLDMGLPALPITYPIMDATVVDENVGRTEDDGSVLGATFYEQFVFIGEAFGNVCHAFLRWGGITISGNIDLSYIRIYGVATIGSTPLMKIYGVKEDNPDAPTTTGEFNGDPLTDEAVDWDVLFQAGWNQSGELKAIFQELVDTYEIANEAVMVQVKDDGSGGNNRNQGVDFAGDSDHAANLYIEYTSGEAPTYLYVNKATGELTMDPNQDRLYLDPTTGKISTATLAKSLVYDAPTGDIAAE